jgi:hypothetical protein
MSDASNLGNAFEDTQPRVLSILGGQSKWAGPEY